MCNELRKFFEKELQCFFKRNTNSFSNVKVLKNKLVINGGGNEASGYIGFDYLNNAHGYVLYAGVDSPELLEVFKSINPPYRSNKPEGIVYSMNTSMEIGFKSFSPNIGGTVDLPRNENEIEKTCEWIYTKVKDIYLPRIKSLIEIGPKVIDDVIENPSYYAYPFLTILHVIKKNNISVDKLNMESILSKKIIGSKSFDKILLDTYL